MSKKINIALYGFGRIGRNLFRLGYDNPNYNFVAISDFGSAETLQYLLSRDSIHGAMEEPVELDGNYLKVKDQHVRVISGGEPGTIPWDALQAEIVIDATGRFLTREKLALHLESGAKRVFLTRRPSNKKALLERLRVATPSMRLDSTASSRAPQENHLLIPKALYTGLRPPRRGPPGEARPPHTRPGLLYKKAFS